MKAKPGTLAHMYQKKVEEYLEQHNYTLSGRNLSEHDFQPETIKAEVQNLDIPSRTFLRLMATTVSTSDLVPVANDTQWVLIAEWYVGDLEQPMELKFQGTDIFDEIEFNYQLETNQNYQDPEKNVLASLFISNLNKKQKEALKNLIDFEAWEKVEKPSHGYHFWQTCRTRVVHDWMLYTTDNLKTDIKQQIQLELENISKQDLPENLTLEQEYEYYTEKIEKYLETILIDKEFRITVIDSEAEDYKAVYYYMFWYPMIIEFDNYPNWLLKFPFELDNDMLRETAMIINNCIDWEGDINRLGEAVYGDDLNNITTDLKPEPNEDKVVFMVRAAFNEWLSGCEGIEIRAFKG